MNKVLTYKGACMTWECDSNGHMNVMYYINKYEHAGRNTDLELDLFSEASDDEVGIVVLEQHIKYLKEVFEDDLLYIESTLLDVGNKAYKVLHEMYNGRSRELVSTMQLVLVLFDKEKRRALPFPKDKREQLLAKIGN